MSSNDHSNDDHGHGGHGDEDHGLEDHGHDSHGHDDHGHVEHAAQPPQKSQADRWWELPFDAMSSFSLLGFILGGCRLEHNQRKKIDLTLDD